MPNSVRIGGVLSSSVTLRNHFCSQWPGFPGLKVRMLLQGIPGWRKRVISRSTVSSSISWHSSKKSDPISELYQRTGSSSPMKWIRDPLKSSMKSSPPDCLERTISSGSTTWVSIVFFVVSTIEVCAFLQTKATSPG